MCVLVFAHPFQIRLGFPVAVITDDCELHSSKQQKCILSQCRSPGFGWERAEPLTGSVVLDQICILRPQASGLHQENEDKKNLPHTVCSVLKICIPQNPNVGALNTCPPHLLPLQCDGIWRQNLWKVIRLRWGLPQRLSG